MQSDASGPELADLFEMQRWMTWIAAEQLVTAIGELLHFRGQRPIAGPEERRCTMLHRSVHRPASRSANASAASQSKRPAATSASSCRSHSSASNSANHARKAARSAGDNCWTAASNSSTLIISILARVGRNDNHCRCLVESCRSLSDTVGSSVNTPLRRFSFSIRFMASVAFATSSLVGLLSSNAKLDV
jgi:hypothetical protein